MEISALFKELKERDCYKEFTKEYPNSYFCAAFFILSDEGDKIQLDFFLTGEDKMASFEYPFSCFKVHKDEIKGAKEQDIKIVVEASDLKEKVMKILEKNKNNMKPTKIIAILKDDIWNLTGLDKFAQMARIKINAKTGEEISFDKGTIMDIASVKKASEQ
jgi:hypothetical protein